ncbi:MAG: hypothetical protein ABIW48_02790 [Burkholderiales bacterium]
MTTHSQNWRRAIGAALLILAAETTWAADAGDRELRKRRDSQQGEQPNQKFTPDQHRDFRESRGEKLRQRFDAGDKDGDRALSKDEAARVAPRLRENFDNIDNNRDGRATPDEVRTFRRERAKMRRIERGESDPRY